MLREVLERRRAEAEAEYSYRIDGEYRWYLIRAWRLGDHHVLVAHHDITRYKRLEMALRNSETRYRSIVDTAHEGIWLIDHQARTTLVNARMAEMLGHTPDSMLGRPLWEFMDDAACAEARRHFDHRREGVRERHDFRFITRAGDDLWTSCSTSPIFDDSGRFAGAIAMVTDVTRQRAAEQRSRAIETEMTQVSRLSIAGEMAAEIAHEINQPLAAIATYLQAAKNHLASTGDAPGGAAENVEKALQQALRAGDVVRNLTAFVRHRSHRHEPVSIAEVLGEIEMLAEAAGGDGIMVRMCIAPLLARVQIDKVQIQQVVLNLVRNAADSCRALPGGPPADTEIIVRAEASGDSVVVSVTDYGVGLAGVDASRLFHAFYTTKPNGMGLGLSISRTIIESHAGRLWAEPGASGGAVFSFTLPCISERP
ncbi:MAG: PAS domain S-box protein [Phycisphaeraceae bacterium]|nr:PAS domain S-box protein [Phycisphaeraceae bacterium]